jgi:hypothetical protein
MLSLFLAIVSLCFRDAIAGFLAIVSLCFHDAIALLFDRDSINNNLIFYHTNHIQIAIQTLLGDKFTST